MFDVVYMLEHLEGNSILKLDTNQNNNFLEKLQMSIIQIQMEIVSMQQM